LMPQEFDLDQLFCWRPRSPDDLPNVSSQTTSSE
jgi:hypothetical protein